MTERKLLSAAVLFGLAALISQPVLSAGKTAPPNILFILTDDQSYETVRAFGHTDIDTPNLDRLAARGTTFTHAYNMGAWHGAVCVASRSMLVTGKTLWRAHALERKLDAERDSGRLCPLRMAAVGYETYFTGKWHIKTSAAHCFDHSNNIRAGMPKDEPEGYNRPLTGQIDPWSPSDPKFGGFWEGGKHWSEVIADDGIGFLQKAAQSERPFFMYLAFNAPHDPRQAPLEYVDRYPLDRVMVPESFVPEYPYNESIGSGRTLRDERLAPFPRDEQAVKVHRREYYAGITHLDTQIGRILDALEALGQTDETWVIFTSDHGLAVGHHGLMGKQNMYDHSLRVPFIVSGPGVKAGAKINDAIYLQDAMATALELAGADREGVEFGSLIPLLAGKPGKRDAVYGAYTNLQRAVIDDGWKLILYPKLQRARLYHVAEDPFETKDLAADPTMDGRKKALFAKLLQLQQEFDDKLKLRPFFPDL